MVRRGNAEVIRRYFIWGDFVRRYSIRENTARSAVTKTKNVLVLITKGGVMKRGREECDDGRRKSVKRRRERFEAGRDVAKNGRIKVRRREAWEGFAHRFNIAAGFSPAREREILRDTFLKILKSTQTKYFVHNFILYVQPCTISSIYLVHLISHTLNISYIWWVQQSNISDQLENQKIILRVTWTRTESEAAN